MLSLWPFPSIIIQYIEFTYPNDCCRESTIDTKLAKHNHCECNYYFSSGWSCTHINCHHYKSLRKYTSLLSLYMFQVHIWARCFDQGETSLVHANYRSGRRISLYISPTPRYQDTEGISWFEPSTSCNLNTTKNRLFLIDWVGNSTWCHLLLRAII